MKNNLWRKGVVGLLLLIVSNEASAHLLGHTSGFAAGIAHPFLGLDHMLAMVAVGLWASLLGGHARWALPASFVTVMVLAAVAAMAGLQLPLVESGVAASVLLLGLLIMLVTRASVATGVLLVGLFATLHGYAHGTELTASTVAWRYIAGFLLATTLLHGAGLVVGLKLSECAHWRYAIGGTVVVSGVWMLVTV